MPDQTHYCAVHGANPVADCPECHPELVTGKKNVEDISGHRVPATSAPSGGAAPMTTDKDADEAAKKEAEIEKRKELADEASLSEARQQAARDRVRIDGGGDKGITDDDQDQDKYDRPSQPAHDTKAEELVEEAEEDEDFLKKPIKDMTSEEMAGALVACENAVRITKPGAKRDRLLKRLAELGGDPTPYQEPTSRI